VFCEEFSINNHPIIVFLLFSNRALWCGFRKSFPRLRGEARRAIRSPLRARRLPAVGPVGLASDPVHDPTGGTLASKASHSVSPALKFSDLCGFAVFHHATISSASANVSSLALASPKNPSILLLVYR